MTVSTVTADTILAIALPTTLIMSELWPQKSAGCDRGAGDRILQQYASAFLGGGRLALGAPPALSLSRWGHRHRCH
ncbi:MAG: hypothetical protein ACFB0G_00375 [Leptolyngbyaceae cyanobacterium]